MRFASCHLSFKLSLSSFPVESSSIALVCRDHGKKTNPLETWSLEHTTVPHRDEWCNTIAWSVQSLDDWCVDKKRTVLCFCSSFSKENIRDGCLSISWPFYRNRSESLGTNKTARQPYCIASCLTVGILLHFTLQLHRQLVAKYLMEVLGHSYADLRNRISLSAKESSHQCPFNTSLVNAAETTSISWPARFPRFQKGSVDRVQCSASCPIVFAHRDGISAVPVFMIIAKRKIILRRQRTESKLSVRYSWREFPFSSFEWIEDFSGNEIKVMQSSIFTQAMRAPDEFVHECERSEDVITI